MRFGWDCGICCGTRRIELSTICTLSTSDSSYQPAYTSQTGWDFTSGVGTPNVANLINAWPYP